MDRVCEQMRIASVVIKGIRRSLLWGHGIWGGEVESVFYMYKTLKATNYLELPAQTHLVEVHKRLARVSGSFLRHLASTV